MMQTTIHNAFAKASMRPRGSAPQQSPFVSLPYDVLRLIFCLVAWDPLKPNDAIGLMRCCRTLNSVFRARYTGDLSAADEMRLWWMRSKRLCTVLGRNGNVNTLRWARRISASEMPVQLPAIIRLLERVRLPRLKTLDLCRVDNGRAVQSLLAALLASKAPRLRNLSLCGNHIANNALPFCKQLMLSAVRCPVENSLSRLHYLNLAVNNITTETAVMLGAALQHGALPGLEYLIIHINPLGVDGVVALTRGLALPTVTRALCKKLAVSNTGITTKDVAAMSAVFEECAPGAPLEVFMTDEDIAADVRLQVATGRSNVYLVSSSD